MTKHNIKIIGMALIIIGYTMYLMYEAKKTA